MKSIRASATKRQKINLCQTGFEGRCSHVLIHNGCSAIETSGSKKKWICSIYISNVRIVNSCNRPTWCDSKWLFCFCRIQRRTEALFLKHWRNQEGTERLKPLVISQCYNSLWLDTITLWTRGQRGDLGVIYCDLSLAGQSSMYANHSGLTLSVPFEIYHDQWSWNELPLGVLSSSPPQKNINTWDKCCNAAFAGRSQHWKDCSWIRAPKRKLVADTRSSALGLPASLHPTRPQ